MLFISDYFPHMRWGKAYIAPSHGRSMLGVAVALLFVSGGEMAYG
jgi:hypothetical protein